LKQFAMSSPLVPQLHFSSAGCRKPKKIENTDLKEQRKSVQEILHT